jgi:signal transduction histidine kinase
MRWSVLLPLSLRVPLIVASLMMLMGIVASQLVLSALNRAQVRQLTELAEIEFTTLSTALGPYVQREDIWEMFDILDRATLRGGGFRPILATLIDARGRVIVSTRPEVHPIGSDGVAVIGRAIRLDDIRYDNAAEQIAVRSTVVWQGRPVGQLVIDFDVREFAAERSRARWILLLGNAAAILVLSFAGYALMRRVLAPIRRLTHEMAQPGGTPQLIPESMIPAQDAELAQLYSTYNGLIRAVQARTAAERRLAERERFVSLGRLAGGLAHEINNPLGGLLNTVDTIRAYADRPEVVRNSAELLDRGLKHLRDVTRTTLDMHRSGDGSGEGAARLSVQDFDDLHLLIRPEIDRKTQSLDWQIEAGISCFNFLPAGPVRQIALNLLLNAVAITQPGGELGLRVCPDGGDLCLCVWDSGPGFTETMKPRLLSDAPIEPGGGLGLRLVRDLVKSLGGTIELGLTPEGRNEVRVRLLRGEGQDA